MNGAFLLTSVCAVRNFVILNLRVLAIFFCIRNPVWKMPDTQHTPTYPAFLKHVANPPHPRLKIK